MGIEAVFELAHDVGRKLPKANQDCPDAPHETSVLLALRKRLSVERQGELEGIAVQPDVAKLVDGYKGRAAISQGEAFDPSPANIDARTEKTTLANVEVLANFDARQVVLMRADWTRRDAAITRALTALGRSGVPVYALYAPGKAPVLLSELPSVSEIQQALRAM